MTVGVIQDFKSPMDSEGVVSNNTVKQDRPRNTCSTIARTALAAPPMRELILELHATVF